MAWVIGAVLLAIPSLPTDARASCVPGTGNTVICTGDLSDGVSETNRTEVTIRDVTAAIGPAAGVPGAALVNSGADGPSGGNGATGPVGTLLLFGPATIITQGAEALTLTVQGGRGGDGVGSASGAGGAGGDGGGTDPARLSTAGGTYTVNATGGAIAALNIRARGGDGGDGANVSFVPGVTVGGIGGDGGTAGLVTFFLPDGTVTTSGSGGAGVARVSSEGGTGGDGGTIESTEATEIRGGNGGNGGAGGPVDFTVTNNAVLAGASGAPVFLAQSLGGAGGVGGNAAIGNTSATAVGGGDGGNGGGAGTVTVSGDFTLERTVAVANSAALVVQSIAGQGGAGGNASDQNGVAIGGDGGIGGTAGAVHVGTETTAFKVSIANQGDQSVGILARSYGGAGGAGGLAFTDGQNGNLKGPGPGADVSVYVEGSVTTVGDAASAVIAQSVGGFSGNASGADLVAFGASAQSGGKSGTVIVDLTPDSADARLSTSGLNSDAVIAQSIGGGGGKLLTGGTLSNLGGSGDAGGDGDAVTVTLNASASGHRYMVSTSGAHARGIYAESIGSGGGSAPTAITSLIGATGGAGGSAGAVTVTVAADIFTAGDGSDAIYAASHGGGGGSGGVNGFNETQIGGSGAGGAGGAVMVDATGTLSTGGADADVIFAQSVGGGGGKGLTVPTETTSFSQTIGGSGGDGGAGGQVTVMVTGAITAAGERSSGVRAQSIGGGGGHGGNTLDLAFVLGPPKFAHALGGSGGSGGTGGAVSVTIDGTASTEGSHAAAILAQSIGGGGGSAGNALAVSSTLLAVSTATGGSGGGGGDADKVSVTATGSLTTTGPAFSPGVVAHSVGGGGGHGGTAVAVTAASLASVAASSGGTGAVAGNGGAVTVATADVATSGSHSHGISALSVGGGGGSGGTSVTASAISLGSINITMGGAGGSGGDGAAVSVTSGAVSTKGDYSAGINALSVGGGGGDSGTVVSVSALDGVQAVASIGATGGAGGNADDVSVTAMGRVSTQGAHSPGVRALSVAGGGGSSGVVVNAGGSDIASISFATGGSGGAAGSSGDVTVKVEDGATAEGILSPAVLATSVAGGGGDAGAVVAVNALTMGDMSVAIGGDGGAGGTAGTVNVTTAGSISTDSVQSAGIIAQSIGGGGGHGGMVAEGSLTAGDISGNLSISIAGSGAAGGKADTVTVTTVGTITTEDYRGAGIVAQSIGGHGGVGGSVIGGNVNLSATAGVSVNLAVGGTGGNGGSAMKVTVNNAAGITTRGVNAVGILAQSIGGSGGDGGGAYTAIASIETGSRFDLSADVGGSGGAGAIGGVVDVTNTGAIATYRGGSAGIHAQSIGGGGGRAGAAANFVLDFQNADGKTLNIAGEFSIGGRGGTGADAGAVTVTNSSTITTDGVRSPGIIATSVGGGGGDGGPASATSIDVQGVCRLATLGRYSCTGPNTGQVKGSLEVSLSIAIGGAGGASGDGEAVTVDNEAGADITTTGRVSHAIFAHSIGGGGGHGGEGGLGIEAWTSNKTIQDITNNFENVTEPPSFTSIGAAIGGSGGASGTGGAVMVTNAATLTTSGDHAFGIHAQSVGGGGGSGGGGSGGLWTALTVGGGGSGGGDGGAVTVRNSGLISTSGIGGVGIFAQSVGGGGGAAGDVENGFAAPWLDLNIGAGVGIQDNAGDGGSGGKIVVHTGTIRTAGARAHGVIAQSVGGSGGIAQVSGFAQDGLATYVGSGGAAGSGGAVTVTTTGTVTVEGANAVGIVALSAAGSGADDTSGAVTINVFDDVTASGSGGRGILASSATQEGQGEGGGVSIAIATGVTVSTGAAGAETIGIVATNLVSVINEGAIRSGNADSFAIRVGDSPGLVYEVQNVTGATLTGSVVLPPSDGSLTNAGTFNMGSLVSFAGAVDPASKLFDGNGLILAEGGTISPAGVGAVGTTDYFAGSLIWDGGIYAPDLRLDGSGNTADLIKTTLPFTDPRNVIDVDGIVAPNLIASAGSGSLSGSAVIMTTNQEFDISTAVVRNTGAARFTLSTGVVDEDSALELGYVISGAPWSGSAAERATVPDGLDDRIGPNTTGFGRYVEAVLLSPVADEEAEFAGQFLTDVVNLPDVPTLLSAYEEYLPEEVFAATDGAVFSNLRFTNDLFSCGSIGASGVIDFDVEGSCGYVRLSGVAVERDGNGSRTGYDERVLGISAGGQARLSDRFVLGGGLGLETGTVDVGGVDNDVLRFNGGIVAKLDLGATRIGASLAGGYYEMDLARSLTGFVPTPSTAESDVTGYVLSAHGRVDHRFDLGDGFFLRPTADLGLTHIRQDSVRETGAGPYGMDLSGFDQTIFTANPFLELGADFTMSGLPARARVRGGVLVAAGGDRETDARFVGLASGPTFTVSDDYDDVFADLGVAFDFALSERVTMEASLDSLLSDNQQSIAAGARLNILF